MSEQDIEQDAALEPVTVSDAAYHALATRMREWSGWPTAILNLDCPEVSPWAQTLHSTRTFTICPETLILNPNRVLLTVTPFRLRQEAVLTGAMLHEAGHARFSLWQPRTAEAIANLKHSDGTPVAPATLALARTMEEPRIEGLIAAASKDIGAAGLDWTMRAMALRCMPMTELSADPNQAIVDLISSWALRAGRRIALMKHTTYVNKSTWVLDFSALLSRSMAEHIAMVNGLPAGTVDAEASSKASDLMIVLNDMITWGGTTGDFMIEHARLVLETLFPETPDDEKPEAGDGCGAAAEPSPSESGQGGAGDEQGQDGEGNTEPEDEGSGDDPGAGDSGSDEDADPEGEDDTEEGGSGEQGDDESDDEGEGEGQDQDADEDGSEADENSETDTESALAKALAKIEAEAGESETEETTEASAKVPGGSDGGWGESQSMGAGWRAATGEEREVKKDAGRFLRSLIEPSEASKVLLTESPSASVDGAALSAWRAGGQVRDPHFFKRIKREVMPSPPVRLAILVDVSASMGVLQEPSALLSWAAASAAVDLRNFAGRGVQVESCLIHWGDSARVVQHNGQNMRGIYTTPCRSGTSAMAEAHDLVEAEMPRFFDHSPTPVNRLMVHFTDWRLHPACKKAVTPQIAKALEVGVNILSVVPSNYSYRHTDLTDILAAAPHKNGSTAVLPYQEKMPEMVWTAAAQVLSGQGDMFG